MLVRKDKSKCYFKKGKGVRFQERYGGGGGGIEALIKILFEEVCFQMIGRDSAVLTSG